MFDHQVRRLHRGEVAAHSLFGPVLDLVVPIDDPAEQRVGIEYRPAGRNLRDLAYLDQRDLEATADERGGAAWVLFATPGMRRGELLGLRWSDVDLDAKTVTVRQTLTMAGDRPEVGTPKSKAGNRRVSIDVRTVTALRARKRTQVQDRLPKRSGWRGGHDLVVTEPDGAAVHPQVFSRRFTARSSSAPGCRRSDCTTCGTATPRPRSLPASPSKSFSAARTRGHRGHVWVYAHVLPGDDAAAADLVTAALTRSL